MDVLVTGYPSIDHIARVSHSPAVDETARLLGVPDRVTYGGCGINVGVALRQLGFAVGAAVVLGDDDYGRAYRAELDAQGIDTTNVIRLPGEATSHSYLFLNPAGQYQNFFFPGAADAWQARLALRNVRGCRFALVTVGQLDYNRQFVAGARAASVPVVWMMKSDVHAYPPDVLREFLDASAIVLMNQVEAAYVLRELELASVTQMLAAGRRAIVVTHGEHGAAVYAPGAAARDGVPVAAVAPSELVDPTGAGDGFAAGFLAGLLKGADPVASAQLGAVIASFVLEAVGCQTKLPGWPAALARYRAQFGEFLGDE